MLQNKTNKSISSLRRVRSEKTGTLSASKHPRQKVTGRLRQHGSQANTGNAQSLIHPPHKEKQSQLAIAPYTHDQEAAIFAFLKTLGVNQNDVKDRALMMVSFTHKSYAADFSGNIAHNERLEFLGDAILGGIVAKRLYELYPNQQESFLTLYKIALVRAETFAEVAQEIGLDNVILLGKGELRNKGRQKTTILCDCLEAFLGYLYLDIGANIVENIVEKYILTKLDSKTERSVKSYKSHLQELFQKLYKVLPCYIETAFHDKETGEMMYKSEVYGVDIPSENSKDNQPVPLGIGIGHNKKKAQEQAAQNAYEELHDQTGV